MMKPRKYLETAFLSWRAITAAPLRTIIASSTRRLKQGKRPRTLGWTRFWKPGLTTTCPPYQTRQHHEKVPHACPPTSPAAPLASGKSNNGCGRRPKTQQTTQMLTPRPFEKTSTRSPRGCRGAAISFNVSRWKPRWTSNPSILNSMRPSNAKVLRNIFMHGRKEGRDGRFLTHACVC